MYMYCVLEYVDAIFKAIEEGLENREILRKTMKYIKDMSPAHMDTMLEKVSKLGLNAHDNGSHHVGH